MSSRDEELRPQDLRDAAVLCTGALRPLEGRDWTAPAGELEWSAQETLDHVIFALLHYAIQLASRATERTPRAASRATGWPVGGLSGVAAVLAEVAAAAPPEARGWHSLGMADRTGFLAMGCDEMLVHTYDITGGFGETFTPPRELCRRVLVRLFPWAPTDVGPWSALLWANGRVALPRRKRLGPEWGWQCAPLSEWDGTMTVA